MKKENEGMTGLIGTHNRESQHTPTPWKVTSHKNDIEQEVFQIRSFTDGSTNGLYIAEMWSAGENESQANAAFIVRAVNSHEALLEALKQAKDLLAKSEEYNDGGGYENRLMNEWESAIAQAEGK